MPKLEGPTKLLLFGVVVSIAVLMTGYAVNQYYSNLVNDLITECKDENKKPRPTDAPDWAKAPLVCDLHKLDPTTTGSDDSLVGVQAKIVETHRHADTWLSRAYMFSAVLMGIFAIPYSWYFLLRRIRELRDAVLGK